VPAIESMASDESICTEAGTKNLRWYEQFMGDMSRLENSRWSKMNPYERCETIRQFLNIRKDTLSVLLKE